MIKLEVLSQDKRKSDVTIGESPLYAMMKDAKFTEIKTEQGSYCLHCAYDIRVTDIESANWSNDYQPTEGFVCKICEEIRLLGFE